ncbi:hypothetical protein BJX64DRAFT_286900 [Aspergillus heterothallicus]
MRRVPFAADPAASHAEPPKSSLENRLGNLVNLQKRQGDILTHLIDSVGDLADTVHNVQRGSSTPICPDCRAEMPSRVHVRVPKPSAKEVFLFITTNLLAFAVLVAMPYMASLARKYFPHWIIVLSLPVVAASFITHGLEQRV